MQTRVEVRVRIVPYDVSLPITEASDYYETADMFVRGPFADIKTTAKNCLLTAVAKRDKLMASTKQEQGA